MGLLRRWLTDYSPELPGESTEGLQHEGPQDRRVRRSEEKKMGSVMESSRKDKGEARGRWTEDEARKYHTNIHC